VPDGHKHDLSRLTLELSALWGGADSYIPKAHLPPDRTRAAVVDNAVLRALA